MGRLFTGALALLTLTAPGLACDANPVCTVKDPTGTPLNIRAGPNDTILGTAKNGTKLEFIDHVEHNGKLWARVARFDPASEALTYGQGMLFAAYLKCDRPLGESIADAPASCIVADPTGTPLNIRDAPNGQILGTVRNGERVRVFGTVTYKGKLWAEAWRDPSENAVGWVFDDYLKCEEDAH